MKVSRLAFVGIALLSTAAAAGFKVNIGVSVYIPASGIASATGSLAGAQNSADANSYLRCSIRAEYLTPTTLSRTLECEARDSNNTNGFCYLNNPPQVFIDIVQSLKDNDTLTFTWDKATQVCKSLELGRSSAQLRTGGST